jgi:hypothetical protein
MRDQVANSRNGKYRSALGSYQNETLQNGTYSKDPIQPRNELAINLVLPLHQLTNHTDHLNVKTTDSHRGVRTSMDVQKMHSKSIFNPSSM